MNYKRKRPRTKGIGRGNLCGGSRKGEAPSYWNLMFNNRPKRRKNKHNCWKITRGYDSEMVIWELGNRKPHNYYW